MSTTPAKLTASEALNSLNGVEYSNANTLAKGRILRLMNDDAIDAMFVLITVLKQRENAHLTLGEVKRDMTLGDVNAYFAPEPDAEDEDSEVGNE